MRPSFAVRLYRFLREQRFRRNVYGSDFKKRALVSYLTRPFTRESDSDHINIMECRLIAEALHALGYRVDAVHWNCRRRIDYGRYDLVFGLGESVERAFWQSGRPLVIAYAPGSHPRFQNEATRRRLDSIDQSQRAGLESSARPSHEWQRSIEESDMLVVVGNEATRETYRPYRQGALMTVAVPGREIFDCREISEQRNYTEAKNHFLFVGGSGLIHKGLDMLLEAFADLPAAHLHICASFAGEEAFAKLFADNLRLPNIHNHGFVDLRSQEFRQILEACAFVVLPSCAEGQSSGVVDAVRNGALIPVVTRETGIDAGAEGLLISEISTGGIREAVARASLLNESELKSRCLAAGSRFVKEHTASRFKSEIMSIISAAITAYERKA